MTKKNILITGSSSRFCRFLKKDLKNHKTFFTKKNQFNILKLNQMIKFVKNKKISHLIHIAGLSRPMSIHDKDISKSIDLNIIGTANIVKLCKKFNIKLIYFSTNYVYPGTKGKYKESDPIFPINNYAWSKLGGESSVIMYKNSLILRIAMTDYPFTHSKAIKGAYSSFIYNKTFSKILPYLINENGILNIGGKRRDIFNFAKNFAKTKIKPLNLNKVKNFPKDSSLNINKLKKILKKFKLKNIII
tara:strand:- start:42 stop:779 length:738 start_codon:yes stop_codon:yes gene_type:complete